MRARLLTNCPICGMPMVHSRLRGYHCHFEQHNEMVRNREFDIAMKNAPPIDDDEIERLLAEAPPIEMSEAFKERALKGMREAAKRRAIEMN